MKTNDHEHDALKDLKRGKYRGTYLVYNRRSTDDVESQKNSIKYQRAENVKFARRERLPIAALALPSFSIDGVVSERHSGFAENLELSFGSDGTVKYRIERPKFYRLVQFLSEGYFKGVIFLCWDRASRNKGDDTILRKLIKAGADIRFTLAHYDSSSAGELHMDIDGMFAEHHSRVTREKVMLAQRNARSRGLVTHKARVGYLNTGSMEHKPFDRDRAPIIQRMFELVDSGDWTLADLARWAITQGFTMPPMRRRRTAEEMLAEEEDDVRLEIAPISRLPTVSTIHQILTNPFYTGKVRGEDGRWVKSMGHEALVSEELFQRVQAKLRRRRTSAHYKEVLAHPFRALLRCAHCGRVYTPYEQKGIIYYGARCTRTCTNRRRSVSISFVVSEVGKLIERLRLTPEELEELEAKASANCGRAEAIVEAERDDSERRKKALREDLAYLDENKPRLLRGGAYTAEGLVAERERLEQDLGALSKTDDQAVGEVEAVGAVAKLSELLKKAAVFYDSANPHGKDKIARVVISELALSHDTLQYKVRSGFEALQGRLVAEGPPIDWLSELSWMKDDIEESTRELGVLLHACEPSTADEPQGHVLDSSSSPSVPIEWADDE